MPVGKRADIALLDELLSAISGSLRSVWLQPLSQSPKATALCLEVARERGWRVLYNRQCRGCQGRTFTQRETPQIARLPFTARGFSLPRLLLNFYALAT